MIPRAIVVFIVIVSIYSFTFTDELSNKNMIFNHLITWDLNTVEDQDVINFLRGLNIFLLQKLTEMSYDALSSYCIKWCKRKNGDKKSLDDVLFKCKNTVHKYLDCTPRKQFGKYRVSSISRFNAKLQNSELGSFLYQLINPPNIRSWCVINTTWRYLRRFLSCRRRKSLKARHSSTNSDVVGVSDHTFSHSHCFVKSLWKLVKLAQQLLCVQNISSILKFLTN